MDCGKRKLDCLSVIANKKGAVSDNCRPADANTTERNFFADQNIYILPTGVGNARLKLFSSQIEKGGGKYLETYNADLVTHIVIAESIDASRLCRIMKIEYPPEPRKTKIVTTLWLSKCIKEKSVVDIEPFLVDLSKFPKPKVNRSADTSNSTSKTDAKNEGFVLSNDQLSSIHKADASEEPMIPKSNAAAYSSTQYHGCVKDDNDSDYLPSDEDANDGTKPAKSDDHESSVSSLSTKLLKRGNWVCNMSSNSKQQNFNQHITDKLEALAKTYQNTNDKWRSFGYQKAIAALKRHPKEITSYQEAESLPGIGSRLAEKIWEIVESGGLRKLEEVSNQEDVCILNQFVAVWGAGPQTARAWIQQGYRSLDDLSANSSSLTRHQQIGLKYYDEILDRMPRAEATEIVSVVREAALSLQPDVLAVACGSYRRGKADCGDVDVLVTHPDGRSHHGLFSKLVGRLKETGFLTDDLVFGQDGDSQKKYLGICKLPGDDRKHRRLDIIVVPYDEFPCALLYFTGSAHFNRSMRNLAGKMGMSLNEHALYTGVIRRNGEKITKGTPLQTKTEESIFQILGLQYRPPEERDF